MATSRVVSDPHRADPALPGDTKLHRADSHPHRAGSALPGDVKAPSGDSGPRRAISWAAGYFGPRGRFRAHLEWFWVPSSGLMAPEQFRASRVVPRPAGRPHCRRADSGPTGRIRPSRAIASPIGRFQAPPADFMPLGRFRAPRVVSGLSCSFECHREVSWPPSRSGTNRANLTPSSGIELHRADPVHRVVSSSLERLRAIPCLSNHFRSPSSSFGHLSWFRAP